MTLEEAKRVKFILDTFEACKRAETKIKKYHHNNDIDALANLCFELNNELKTVYEKELWLYPSPNEAQHNSKSK